MKMNFDNFQIQKSISQTAKNWKSRWKNGVIWLVSIFPSLSRNMNLLKQFIYVYLKDIIILFQKTCFTVVWATVHGIEGWNMKQSDWLWRNSRKLINFKHQYLLSNSMNTIFDNLRTVSQEGDMRTRQMTPFFHLLFES